MLKIKLSSGTLSSFPLHLREIRHRLLGWTVRDNIHAPATASPSCSWPQEEAIEQQQWILRPGFVNGTGTVISHELNGSELQAADDPFLAFCLCQAIKCSSLSRRDIRPAHTKPPTPTCSFLQPFYAGGRQLAGECRAGLARQHCSGSGCNSCAWTSVPDDQNVTEKCLLML